MPTAPPVTIAVRPESLAMCALPLVSLLNPKFAEVLAEQSTKLRFKTLARVITNLSSGPRRAQCPLHSESDRSASSPRNVAMLHQQSRGSRLSGVHVKVAS